VVWESISFQEGVRIGVHRGCALRLSKTPENDTFWGSEGPRGAPSGLKGLLEGLFEV
jgi:hypothetical protein